MSNKADWMSESTKNLFEQSHNERLQEVGEEEEEEVDAVWKDGKVFVGWELGSKEELNQIIQRFQRRTDADRNEAIRKGIQKFVQLVKQRKAMDDKKVWIDRSEPDVAFIAGERGSGKSFLMRAMTDRSAKTGMNHVYFDMENELYTSNTYKGIQKGLMMLRHNEDRQNIDTKVLMPEYVYQAREKGSMPERGYEHMDRFKFGFDILDADSINTILVEKFGNHADFSSFTNRLSNKIENGEISSWSNIKDLAEKMQDEAEFSYNRRGTQINNFIKNNYESEEFLGPDKKVNFEDIFKEYNRIAMVFHGGSRLNSDLMMNELYASFTIKRIRNLMERNKIDGHLRFDIEEAHKLIPADTDPDKPVSKQQVRQVIKQDRKRGLSLNMATQSPNDVQSRNFLSQTKYYFMPQNLRPRPRKKLLKEADAWERGDGARNKFKRIFEAMDKYQWFMVNSERGTWKIIEPASPLSRHRTS